MGLFGTAARTRRTRARTAIRAANRTVNGSIITILVGGYLLGSLPIANRVANRHGVDDLRSVGDGNPGYWNARETLGTRAARPILVGDTLKGAAAATIGSILLARAASWPSWHRHTRRRSTEAMVGAAVGGGAAMLGHSFPLFAGFRGGRSVLTFVGTAAVMAPAPAAAASTLAGVVWTTTRRFDRAARAGVAAFPMMQLVLEGPRRTAVTGTMMTFVGLRFAALRSQTAPR